MCQFFSAVITKDKILYDLNSDSHEIIIENNNLDDTTLKPDFIRVEYIPTDYNIFNHDVNNWKLKIDQDLIPDWFNKEKTEKEVIDLFFNKIVKELFLINNNQD